MQDPAILHARVEKSGLEAPFRTVVFENPRAKIPPIDRVMDCARELQAMLASHQDAKMSLRSGWSRRKGKG